MKTMMNALQTFGICKGLMLVVVSFRTRAATLWIVVNNHSTFDQFGNPVGLVLLSYYLIS